MQWRRAPGTTAPSMPCGGGSWEGGGACAPRELPFPAGRPSAWPPPGSLTAVTQRGDAKKCAPCTAIAAAAGCAGPAAGAGGGGGTAGQRAGNGAGPGGTRQRRFPGAPPDRAAWRPRPPRRAGAAARGGGGGGGAPQGRGVGCGSAPTLGGALGAGGPAWPVLSCAPRPGTARHGSAPPAAPGPGLRRPARPGPPLPARPLRRLSLQRRARSALRLWLCSPSLRPLPTLHRWGRPSRECGTPRELSPAAPAPGRCGPRVSPSSRANRN